MLYVCSVEQEQQEEEGYMKRRRVSSCVSILLEVEDERGLPLAWRRRVVLLGGKEMGNSLFFSFQHCPPSHSPF
jgi:hypothetical protein